MFHDPTNRTLARIPAGLPPQLLVVVDTEEEFDWRSFDRANTSVAAMTDVHHGQNVCDAHGIVPTYVADYPVVTQATGYEPLRAFLREGRATIGAHLHPWVTPPFDEVVNAANSYPGNLPAELEQAKLRRLGEAIEQNLGVRPLVYKAGRYGIGPNTARILEAEGYQVDCSPSPAYDFSADGGPDYARADARPYWFGRGRRLLCVPTTGAFVGHAGGLAPTMWRLATGTVAARLHVPGVLSRLGVVSRIRLSPEGFDLHMLVRLTRFLFARGQRVFSLSFHSSTLRPGCTRYVQTVAERAAFLGVMNNYFSWFRTDLGGKPTTPQQLREQLLAADKAVTA
jgi:hypothetical protein